MNFLYSEKHLLLGVTAFGLTGLSTLAPPAQAAQLQQGFAGAYAPANWTLNLDGPYPGDAKVDTTGAPDSITLVGSRSSVTQGFFYTEYITRAAASGPVTFDWSFTGDYYGANIFGYRLYRLNGDRENIIISPSATEPSGIQVDSGTTRFDVSFGDSFGFYNFNFSDFGRGTAKISTFSAPVPSPLPLLGVGAAFSYSRHLRRRTTRAHGPVSTDPVNPCQL
jgi:hypothetical protein